MKFFNNERKKINIGVLLFRLISLIIILVCLFMLYRWNEDNNANSEIADNLLDDSIVSVTKSTPTEESDIEYEEDINTTPIYEVLNVNFEELLAQNDHTVGWVKVNNTNINFPIVQASDNDYYLTRNFNQKKNSAGWIYADASNNLEFLDKNTIIYGHNRRNGTMFSNLRSLLNPEWFNDKSNKYFSFNTKNHKYIAQIFSVYRVNKNKFYLHNNYETEEDFNNFIDDCKQKSVYDFDLDVSYIDDIITLCTCDNNTQYRVVVFAKLVPMD